MELFSISQFILAIVILAVAAAAAWGIRRAVLAKRKFSRELFGTESLTEAAKRQSFEAETRPRSLSDVSSLYLPRIRADFPELDVNAALVRAQNLLTSYLMAIDADDPKLLAEGAPCLREELWLRISSLRDAGQREQYDKVHVHRCALSGYEYADGIRTLVVQAAVQYKYGLFEKEGGELLKGRPDRMVQERYEMGLCYVQDPDKLTDARKRELALSCPKCGAPLTNVGALKCSYCGTPIVPVNLRAWQFMWVRKG